MMSASREVPMRIKDWLDKQAAMNDTPPLDLDAMAARVNAARPGPWVASHYLDDGRVGIVNGAPELFRGGEIIVGLGSRLTEADAAFIAAARQDIPALIAAQRALAARLADATSENQALRQMSLEQVERHVAEIHLQTAQRDKLVRALADAKRERNEARADAAAYLVALEACTQAHPDLRAAYDEVVNDDQPGVKLLDGYQQEWQRADRADRDLADAQATVERLRDVLTQYRYLDGCSCDGEQCLYCQAGAALAARPAPEEEANA